MEVLREFFINVDDGGVGFTLLVVRGEEKGGLEFVP